MIYGFNCLILDITDDELNIDRNVWNMKWRQSTAKMILVDSRVFIARSTSQRHTVSKSTAMSFIPRQYSWDYRHKHGRRK